MSLYDSLFEELGGDNYTSYFYTHCIQGSHADSKPSMCVWEDEDKKEGQGRFRCLSCGWNGSHDYLWKFIHGKSFIPSKQSMRKEVKFLPNWSKWQRDYGSIEALVESANHNLLTMPIFQSYFNKRQLMDVVKPLKLGYKDTWALFPIFEPQGKIVDVLCRNTLKIGTAKYVIHPNNQDTPYLYVPNWKRVDSESTVYIVYGIVDAIALEMCGLPVITGSTGKSLSNKRLINLNKKWIIIPDRDEELAARTLAMELGNFTKILRLDFEENEKDPDDVRMKRGIKTLTRLIRGN